MNLKHNKEIVIRNGLKLFYNKGYQSLGVDEICKVTGMTKGAFYNAFKSKEQFLIEAVFLYEENNIKRIKAELEPTKKKTAFKRLHQFYINMLEAQPKVCFTGCFINNIMAELGIGNELVGKISHNAFTKFIEAIEPTIIEAQKNGEIMKSINSKQLTQLIHSTFYGALTIAKSSRDKKQSIQTINLLFNNLKSKTNE